MRRSNRSCDEKNCDVTKRRFYSPFIQELCQRVNRSCASSSDSAPSLSMLRSVELRKSPRPKEKANEAKESNRFCVSGTRTTRKPLRQLQHLQGLRLGPIDKYPRVFKAAGAEPLVVRLFFFIICDEGKDDERQSSGMSVTCRRSFLRPLIQALGGGTCTLRQRSCAFPPK